MSKVPTYVVNNILLVIFSTPALVLLVAGVSTLLRFPSGWIMPVAVASLAACIAAGVVLSLRSARKVRDMAASGYPEEGLQYSKRVHRAFLGVFIMTWLLGLLSAVYVPSYTAYRSRNYNMHAKEDLKNFYLAAENYFQKNPDGRIDLQSARRYGFKPSPGVKPEIQEGKRTDFSAAMSHPDGTIRYVINMKGEITEQRMPGR